MAELFNANNSSCAKILQPYVLNITASYADKSNESITVFISIVMLIFAALFFVLNLFSRVSDVSAILNPTVRIFLSASLALFLPVMSYLFSEAKNGDSTGSAKKSPGQQTELSLRARTILLWMLLVELLRKKVEAVLVNAAGKQGYFDTIERASRIGFQGYLVFFNLVSTGKKAFYGTLWVLAAAKLLQRVAMNEVLKRSFAYEKNARLLSSYMAQILQEEHEPELEGDAPELEGDASELLKKCKYAVMGEDSVEIEAGPEGYHLDLAKAKPPAPGDDETATVGRVVTVGEIWALADTDHLLQRDQRLKRLCLSFALYKLLRRRIEFLPITAAETHNCRRLILRGLCKEGTDKEAIAAALFQVLNDEVQFLCEYYHSFLPVVLSNPFFFLANYIMFPITVWAFCLLTIILCGNGNLAYVFHSIKSDNYALLTGIPRMTGCILRTIFLRTPSALFSTIDLSITILLMLAFAYEEVWEFIVFILSNWLMVSLLCDYTAKPHWRVSPLLRGTINRILWVRNMLSRPNLSFKQFSVMRPLRGLPLMPLGRKPVPKEVKVSIMERLCDGRLLSNGWSALERHHPELSWSWACKSNSVGEVILTWHIATSLLEVKHPRQKGTTSAFATHRKVAATLSKYCSYLVAFRPELLPDIQEGTERVYSKTRKELKEAGNLGCLGYHFSPEGTLCEKILAARVDGHVEMATKSVVCKGATLGKKLIDEAERGNEAQVWKILADVWTELMVYVAPSSDEAHVKAHKEALAQGGEFITVLWALATHTGVTRPAVKPWAVIPVEEVDQETTLPDARV